MRPIRIAILVGLGLWLIWPLLRRLDDVVTTPMDLLRLVLIGGPTLWLVWRATQSTPPRSRWTRFAEKHGLERLPSTPFAETRLDGLWPSEGKDAPIPVSIRILRHAPSTNTKAEVRAHVPSGLPWGLWIDRDLIREPMEHPGIQGFRGRELARRIDQAGLQRMLLRFFEDWPNARIHQGCILLQLHRDFAEPARPIEEMVELCKHLRDRSEPEVDGPSLPTDPSPIGPMSTMNEVEDDDSPALALKDWTPFGSSFGLKAPDMKPPDGSPPGAPLKNNAAWSSLPPTEEQLLKIRALGQATDARERKKLLGQLERYPLSLTQRVDEILPTDADFLPPALRRGRSTFGKIAGLDVLAIIRHPNGLDPRAHASPWHIQIVDWDEEKGALLGHHRAH